MSESEPTPSHLDSDHLRAMHAADIADLFDETTSEEHALIMSALDGEKRAELLVYLDAHERRDLLDEKSPAQIAELLGELESDDAADLIGELEEQTQIRVLKVIEEEDPKEADEVRSLMDYPADSAGGLMQAEIASIEYSATAGEALEVLRASQDDADSMHFIFVTDDQGQFIGVVRMARLALAQPSSPIAAIFEPKFIDVQAHVDQEEVAQIFAKYDIISLAVVDENERLLGRIMVDDVLEVWAQEGSKNPFQDKLFYHVSTDEVFGSLEDEGLFTETTAYDPRSPYSASKASSDHFVRAYHETYGLPIVISNCSNNYGPNQFPEKLIPLMISNIIEKKELPIYGDGKYTRDWLYVEDHAEAINTVYQKGKHGETYCIGGWNELQNIDLVHELCDLMDSKLSLKIGSCKGLIKFIKDRPGHDKRYAIDARKIENELNWRPKETFQSGIEKTIDWYLKNTDWLKNVTSGSYQNYYSKHYGNK